MAENSNSSEICGADLIAHELGCKAKELMNGMRQRAKRDPDIADFTAAFKPIILKVGRRETDGA